MSEATATATVKKSETQVARSYETKFESDSLSGILEVIDTFVENETADEDADDFPGVSITVIHADEEWKGIVIITYNYA